MRTGTFRVSSGFRLIDPSSPARYAYDLFHNVGDRVPDSMTYTVTPAIRSQLAEIDARFYGVDGNTAPYTEQRYGLTDSGFHHAPRNIAVQAPPIPTRQGAGPGSHGFGANRDRPQDT